MTPVQSGKILTFRKKNLLHPSSSYDNPPKNKDIFPTDIMSYLSTMKIEEAVSSAYTINLYKTARRRCSVHRDIARSGP